MYLIKSWATFVWRDALYHSHNKRDFLLFWGCSLLIKIWELVGISKDFLFGEDLEEILSWIESDCFHILPEGASMVQKHFLKCRTKNLRLIQARNAPKHSRGMQHHFSSKQKKKIFTLSIVRLSYPKVNRKILFS